jgi:hypothetical protein
MDAISSGLRTDGGGDSSIKASSVTAGEWNDIDHWSYWTDLMKNSEWQKKQDYWGFFPESHCRVTLTNLADLPICDAVLTAQDNSDNILWQSHTDNFGHAMIYSSLFGSANAISKLSAEYRGAKFDLDTTLLYTGEIKRQVNSNLLSTSTIDLMFIVDATGSMGDEMEYLKAELKDVLDRSRSQLEGNTYRYASIFYKDHGDDYLTREFPFSSNANDLINFISAQQANGGGDYPEAGDEALEKAVNSMQWSSTARARIAFLLLDAPPHHEQSNISRVQNAVRNAAAMGIKLIPITASGIDKETEFLMRFLSISTNGTYVFITDDSGIGNKHLIPTVGDYKVEYLNDLLVRLIVKYGS